MQVLVGVNGVASYYSVSGGVDLPNPGPHKVELIMDFRDADNYWIMSKVHFSSGGNSQETIHTVFRFSANTALGAFRLSHDFGNAAPAPTWRLYTDA